MPSYLEMYEGAADRREEKFIRAVDSFISQDYMDKELVIVSDGCAKTITIYNERYKTHANIKLVKLYKQPLFSGIVRQKGIEASTGEAICYLDTDDFFGEKHLLSIVNGFDGIVKWVYWNDYLRGVDTIFKRNVELKKGLIGTSSFAHLKSVDLTWYDGYGHDWFTINDLLINELKYKKIEAFYLVCHIQNANINY